MSGHPLCHANPRVEPRSVPPLRLGISPRYQSHGDEVGLGYVNVDEQEQFFFFLHLLCLEGDLRGGYSWAFYVLLWSGWVVNQTKVSNTGIAFSVPVRKLHVRLQLANQQPAPWRTHATSQMWSPASRNRSACLVPRFPVWIRRRGTFAP